MLFPILDPFTYYVCLFCSHIVDNIMEFNATVIQASGKLAIKPASIHHFLQKKIPVPSQECDIVSHSFDMFEFWILFWILSLD